jgi:hypothetical protein
MSAPAWTPSFSGCCRGWVDKDWNAKLCSRFEAAEESGYVGWIAEIPEAMSQGESLGEAKENLVSALKLVLQIIP